MYLNFKVTGEYITQAVRAMLYEQNDMKKAVDYLVECIDSNEISYEEKLGIVLQVLDGKAELVGVSGEDLHLEETPENESLGVLTYVSTLAKKLKEKDEELSDMRQKYLFLLDELELSDYKLKELNSTYKSCYGEPLFEGYNDYEYSDVQLQIMDQWNQSNSPKKDVAMNMLDSYMKRMTDHEEHTTEDYGWLEPDGTFHEVEWGEHSSWAKEYCEVNYPFSEYRDMYWSKPDEYGHRTNYVNGDFLIYKLHWVLLDSPFQGLARVQYDEAYGLTKAQKEFLYDYYMERGRNNEANNLWNDDLEIE